MASFECSAIDLDVECDRTLSVRIEPDVKGKLQLTILNGRGHLPYEIVRLDDASNILAAAGDKESANSTRMLRAEMKAARTSRVQIFREKRTLALNFRCSEEASECLYAFKCPQPNPNGYAPSSSLGRSQSNITASPESPKKSRLFGRSKEKEEVEEEKYESLFSHPEQYFGESPGFKPPTRKLTKEEMRNKYDRPQRQRSGFAGSRTRSTSRGPTASYPPSSSSGERRYLPPSSSYMDPRQVRISPREYGSDAGRSERSHYTARSERSQYSYTGRSDRSHVTASSRGMRNWRPEFQPYREEDEERWRQRRPSYHFADGRPAPGIHRRRHEEEQQEEEEMYEPRVIIPKTPAPPKKRGLLRNLCKGRVPHGVGSDDEDHVHQGRRTKSEQEQQDPESRYALYQQKQVLSSNEFSTLPETWHLDDLWWDARRKVQSGPVDGAPLLEKCTGIPQHRIISLTSDDIDQDTAANFYCAVQCLEVIRPYFDAHAKHGTLGSSAWRRFREEVQEEVIYDRYESDFPAMPPGLVVQRLRSSDNLTLHHSDQRIESVARELTLAGFAHMILDANRNHAVMSSIPALEDEEVMDRPLSHFWIATTRFTKRANIDVLQKALQRGRRCIQTPLRVEYGELLCASIPLQQFIDVIVDEAFPDIPAEAADLRLPLILSFSCDSTVIPCLQDFDNIVTSGLKHLLAEKFGPFERLERLSGKVIIQAFWSDGFDDDDLETDVAPRGKSSQYQKAPPPKKSKSPPEFPRCVAWRPSLRDQTFTSRKGRSPGESGTSRRGNSSRSSRMRGQEDEIEDDQVIFDHPTLFFDEDLTSLSESSLHKSRTYHKHNISFVVPSDADASDAIGLVLDPVPSWTAGVSMCPVPVVTPKSGDALPLLFDAGLFAGTGGFRVKPDGLLRNEKKQIHALSRRRVVITVLAARALPRGRGRGPAVVKVFTRGVEGDEYSFDMSPVHGSDSINPHYSGEDFAVELVDPEVTIFGFEVRRQGALRPEFLCWRAAPLIDLRPGLRVLEMWDRDLIPIPGACLLVHIGG